MTDLSNKPLLHYKALNLLVPLQIKNKKNGLSCSWL